MHRVAVLGLVLAAAWSAVGVACGNSSAPSGFPATGTDAGGGGGGGDDAGMWTGDDSGFNIPDTNQPPQDSAPPPPKPVVYAHSPNQLYKLDPTTKAVTVVGTFNGDCTSHNDCGDIIDLALDANSSAYMTTFGGFYKLDLKAAATTFISNGNYPNSLSFVPKGTLDPAKEALVGYFGSTYVRIDETTGAITNVGGLTNGLASSGDIVSVIGGGTFLTVNGVGCSDCLLQVDPKTGDMIQNYGTVNHQSVYGIAFWAGTVYGFDNGGEMFSITYSGSSITTTNIPVPMPPPGLQFWGAGSTTTAPPTDSDGGGIPIR